MTHDQELAAEKQVLSLIERAEQDGDAGKALHFTQAAVNAANAMCALRAVTK